MLGDASIRDRYLRLPTNTTPFRKSQNKALAAVKYFTFLQNHKIEILPWETLDRGSMANRCMDIRRIIQGYP